MSSVHRRITVNKSGSSTCNSQLITIDSSPKPHTSTSNCGGNCVNHKHSSPIPFSQSPFNSPPTKVSKSTIGMYTSEHQVESIVSNFGKLKSPGKSAHLTASSLSDVDRHTKTCTSCVNNSLSDQHVKSNPLPALNQELSTNSNSSTHKSDSRSETPVMFGIYPPFPNQYSYNPFIPVTNSPATGSSVRSNNLSIDFLPNL